MASKKSRIPDSFFAMASKYPGVPRTRPATTSNPPRDPSTPPATASNKPHTPNVFAYWHNHLLRTYVEKNDPLDGHTPRPKLKEFTDIVRRGDPPNLPICIIGAGVAGLYAAMILGSLGINYQIVEANGRVGGRVATHEFPNGDASDYFDYGAMRYPDTPFMKRTFDLFRNRELPGINLIPYTLEMVNPPGTWLYFNGIRVNNRATNDVVDPFQVGNYVNEENLKTQGAVLDKLQQVIQPFRDFFRPAPDGTKPGIAQAVATLFQETNRFSLKSYMLTVAGMDPKDVNWCQTLTDAEGTFDLSLTQYVLDSVSWDWPTTNLGVPEDPGVMNEGWYCLEGGSAMLPYAMFNSLSENARLNTLFESPVTAISREFQDVGTPDDPRVMEVMKISINDLPHPPAYSAVISTVPLPCLGLMDLSNSGLHQNYPQWNAIHALSCAPALRVGMRFTTAWWRGLPVPITGGESFTDLTIRNIKYPSYETNVLIVTFVKLKDHGRVAALINSDGSAKPRLLEVIFRDLAAVHGVDINTIKGSYIHEPENFFGWDWAQDPTAMGFAYFSAGVYGDGDMYGALLEPAALGKLFLAGDAASAAHAWVVGSLYSAWRVVDQYLTIHRPELLDDFYADWGSTEYWDGPHPGEGLGGPPPGEGGDPAPVEGLGDPPPDEGGHPAPGGGGHPAPGEGGHPAPGEGELPAPGEGGHLALGEVSDNSYRGLTRRLIMIALQRDGVIPGAEPSVPPGVL